MSIGVKRRRGTTLEHGTFAGLEGEITIDTDKKTVVVHDGVTLGGIPLAKESSLPTTIEKSKWNSKAISFYIDDVLEVGENAMSIISPLNLTITDIRVMVDIAPTDADLIIDINLNGTTLYTTQANRPTILATTTSITATLPDIVAISLGDKITLDIDQVGSTIAGENLSVTIICEVS